MESEAAAAAAKYQPETTVVTPSAAVRFEQCTELLEATVEHLGKILEPRWICRRFNKRWANLLQRSLVKHAILLRSANIARFYETLVARPDLAPHVQSITVFPNSLIKESYDGPDGHIPTFLLHDRQEQQASLAPLLTLVKRNLREFRVCWPRIESEHRFEVAQALSECSNLQNLSVIGVDTVDYSPCLDSRDLMLLFMHIQHKCTLRLIVPREIRGPVLLAEPFQNLVLEGPHAVPNIVGQHLESLTLIEPMPGTHYIYRLLALPAFDSISRLSILYPRGSGPWSYEKLSTVPWNGNGLQGDTPFKSLKSLKYAQISSKVLKDFTPLGDLPNGLKVLHLHLYKPLVCFKSLEELLDHFVELQELRLDLRDTFKPLNETQRQELAELTASCETRQILLHVVDRGIESETFWEKLP